MCILWYDMTWYDKVWYHKIWHVTILYHIYDTVWYYKIVKHIKIYFRTIYYVILCYIGMWEKAGLQHPLHIVPQPVPCHLMVHVLRLARILHRARLARFTVNRETGLRPNSAGIPSTLLLRMEAIGASTVIRVITTRKPNYYGFLVNRINKLP